MEVVICMVSTRNGERNIPDISDPLYHTVNLLEISSPKNPWFAYYVAVRRELAVHNLSQVLLASTAILD